MSRPRGLDGSSVLLDVLAMHTIEMIPKSMILNNSVFKNIIYKFSVIFHEWYLIFVYLYDISN